MKIIEPSYTILTSTNGIDCLKQIESAGRTCYKSEDKITDDSCIKFTKNLIKRKHEAMIEFADITVKFIHNRGFTHELVRHRLCSYAQESTRYCNYSKDKFGGEITFIKPCWWDDESIQYIGGARLAWENCMLLAEKNYMDLINCGLTAQEARGVLPNDLKTEIVIKANIREWRNILNLRTSSAAHPDMRRVMIPLLNDFITIYPILFDDIVYSN